MFSSVQWRKRCTDFALYSHLPCQQQKSFVSLFIISLMLLILEHCVHFKIPQPKKDKKNKEMENSFFLRKGVIQLFPAFLKFALHHFTLMKDRHQYLFSLTKRNRAFVRKVKVKIGFGVCSVALSHHGDSTPHIIMRAAAGLLPWEPWAASQHQAAIALRCVSGHWCFFFFFLIIVLSIH